MVLCQVAKLFIIWDVVFLFVVVVLGLLFICFYLFVLFQICFYVLFSFSLKKMSPRSLFFPGHTQGFATGSPLAGSRTSGWNVLGQNKHRL